jgi:hypothetical protein
MKELLKELHHKPIAYYPIYRKITGSTTAGILLSQLTYWWAKMDGEKFYKTDLEVMEETLLTADELRAAKALIKGMAFITITREGLPAKTFYDIDSDKLYEQICLISTNKIREIPETVLGDSPQLYSIVQENTTIESPLTPTSGGTDDQPANPLNQKARATKKAGAACAGATEADFLKFANPEMALLIWRTWIDYKKMQKGFTYKTEVAQAAAITRLFNCSGGSIQKARAVIDDAMANGYTGFFPYKDEMAFSVRNPEPIVMAVDDFPLDPKYQERYDSTTRWFFKSCPSCTGVRWLSKKEFMSVINKSEDLIPPMWYTKCPEEDFNSHVTKSISSLNASPRWEKEKWPSIFDWLRHDLKIRIFGKKENQ